MVYKNILRYFSLLLGGLCVLVLCLTYRGTYNWVLYIMEWLCDYLFGIKLGSIWFDPNYSYLLAPLPPHPIEGSENCFMITTILQWSLMNLDFLFFFISLAVLSSLYLIWFRKRDWAFKMEDCWLLFCYPHYMIYCVWARGFEIWKLIPANTLESFYGCLLFAGYYLVLFLTPTIIILMWKDKNFLLWFRFLVFFFITIAYTICLSISAIHLEVGWVALALKDFGQDYVASVILNHFGLGYLVAYCMTDYEIMMRYCKPQKEWTNISCKAASVVEGVHIPKTNNKIVHGIGLGIKGTPILACTQAKHNLANCIKKWKVWEQCKKDVEK